MVRRNDEVIKRSFNAIAQKNVPNFFAALAELQVVRLSSVLRKRLLHMVIVTLPKGQYSKIDFVILICYIIPVLYPVFNGTQVFHVLHPFCGSLFFFNILGCWQFNLANSDLTLQYPVSETIDSKFLGSLFSYILHLQYQLDSLQFSVVEPKYVSKIISITS